MLSSSSEDQLDGSGVIWTRTKLQCSTLKKGHKGRVCRKRVSCRRVPTVGLHHIFKDGVAIFRHLLCGTLSGCRSEAEGETEEEYITGGLRTRHVKSTAGVRHAGGGGREREGGGGERGRECYGAWLWFFLSLYFHYRQYLVNSLLLLSSFTSPGAQVPN